MDISSPIARSQGPNAVLHIAKLLATRTRLSLGEQLGLLDRKILHDMLRDSPSNLASRVFNASKRGFLPSQVNCLKIDAKFLGDSFKHLTVFLRPRTLEHLFILELMECDERQNTVETLTETIQITY
jgi:hypothetical protein